MLFFQILTILNTLGLLFYFYINKNNWLYYLKFTKEKTTIKKTLLLGYKLTLWKRRGFGASSTWSLYLPVKNKEKIELLEEVEMLKTNTNQRQILYAKFSWLKTYEEVEKFNNKYREVNPTQVDELVSNFFNNKQW